jgi:hypothetical protein
MDIKAAGLDVLVKTADTDDFDMVITVPGGTPQTVTLSADPTLGGVHHWSITLSPQVDLGRAPTPPSKAPPTWTIKLKKAATSDFRSLTASDVDDFALVVAYEVSS